MKKIIPALVGIAILASLAGNASAQIINIQLGGTATFPTNGPVAFTGQGALSDPGNNTWNTEFGTGGTFTNLLTSSGGASSVGLIEATTNTQNLNTSPFPVTNPLLNSYVFTDNSSNTVTLTGLTPGQDFNLYLYGTNSQDNGGAQFTIGSVSQTTSGAPGTIYTLGSDYVVYSGIAADPNGDITIGYTAPAGAEFSAFNGLQLQATPEPSTWAMMLGGLGLLFVVLRRRSVLSV